MTSSGSSNILLGLIFLNETLEWIHLVGMGHLLPSLDVFAGFDVLYVNVSYCEVDCN